MIKTQVSGSRRSGKGGVSRREWGEAKTRQKNYGDEDEDNDDDEEEEDEEDEDDDSSC